MADSGFRDWLMVSASHLPVMGRARSGYSVQPLSLVSEMAPRGRNWPGILGSVPFSWPSSLFLFALQGAPHKPRALGSVVQPFLPLDDLGARPCN